MSDELSAPVLTFNLLLPNTSPLTEILAAAHAATMPIHLTIRLLRATDWNGMEAPPRVFVVRTPRLLRWRLSFISQNWRGRPLVSHQAIVNLIAATTTRTGLRVKAALDTRRYETAVQIPDDVFARLRITPHAFHGDWNYNVVPRR